MDFTATTIGPDEISASSESPVMPATTCRSIASSIQDWEKRIRDVQSKRATPELLAKIKADNERQRSATALKKKAMRLERTNMLNCAQSAMALQTFARAPASAAAAPAAYEDRSARTAKYGKSINACLAKSKARRSAPAKSSMSFFGARGGSHASDCDSSDDDLNDLESEMRNDMYEQDELAGDVDGATSSAIRSVFDYATMNAQQQQQVSSTLTSELQTLLQQLVTEPTNDAEIAAKFVLFENFLANVVAIREETLEFWEESKIQFTGATKAACEREIRGIDNEIAMGIVDDPRKWFVYSMTKKASDNSSNISQLLARFRSRLDLLSQEIGECPYCLDQMTLDQSTVLGCCHRVCTDCWTHWVELKKDAAFCPLCRHEEFISEVLR